jgi:hypothetical protein
MQGRRRRREPPPPLAADRWNRPRDWLERLLVLFLGLPQALLAPQNLARLQARCAPRRQERDGDRDGGQDGCRGDERQRVGRLYAEQNRGDGARRRHGGRQAESEAKHHQHQ